MHALNLRLFEWMAAGVDPSPWLLWAAYRIAVGSSWMCIAIIGWVAWRQQRHRGFVLAVVLAAGAASLVSHGIASALNMPRPFVLGLSPVHLAHGTSGSLPSTHAAVMFTDALMFVLRTGLLWYGIALFALAAATGWARIYVGVHFPADIAAGLLLGIAVAGVFVLLQRFVERVKAPSALHASAPGKPS